MISLLITVLLATHTSAPCADAVPLIAGRSWTYAGYALSSRPGAAVHDSSDITHVMRIVRVREVGSDRIALVAGSVFELAWHERGNAQRLSLLMCRGSQLSAQSFESDAEATRAFELWRSERAEGERPLLILPLRAGQIFGQSPARDDPLYGWSVEVASPRLIPKACGAADGEEFTLKYRTLPDHTIVDWKLGAGVTRFEYVHQGTPAATVVRLTGCSR